MVEQAIRLGGLGCQTVQWTKAVRQWTGLSDSGPGCQTVDRAVGQSSRLSESCPIFKGCRCLVTLARLIWPFSQKDFLLKTACV